MKIDYYERMYYYQETYEKKEDALAKKKEIESKGVRARVSPTRGGYALYTKGVKDVRL